MDAEYSKVRWTVGVFFNQYAAAEWLRKRIYSRPLQHRPTALLESVFGGKAGIS
jgi:hypothetical protein